ncbi:glucosamine-6-phosphate deaminase [Pueribacillus theae]|uniref:Glucosamine-6-phosphate deaminase n=1 Tax=Pueribacillus theae TaxID=2171751 RepID=A0A2U1JYQ6_9BACI|nr:glucosamine-6-phosphate deaminase [Pueribacillus theae]PWA10079.1 glucosamine-6-phosphate deaminase [Pueribacillus theae]
MNVIQVDTYEELSKKAAEIIINKVKQNPSAKLGLATGSTPVGSYKLMIEDHKRNGTSYEDIITVNLDEYVGLNADHPSSYRFFMDEQLFDSININKKNTHVPNGTAEDLKAECKKYEAMIDELGGLDLQLLGIGQNGHIGFNEPGTPFNSVTHVVDLTPNTRDVNSRFFSSIEEVPTKAITMGIASILKSKEILLLISGEAKAEALHKLLHGNIDESFPASALKNHPNFTVIFDKAALKGV